MAFNCRILACLLWIFSVFCTFDTNGYLFPLAARLPIPGTPSPWGSPWPLPQEWFNQSELITIGSNLEYSSNAVNCKILDDAFRDRFSFKTLFKDQEPIPDETFPILSKVHVNFLRQDIRCNEYPKLEENKENESYNLTIGTDGNEGTATITAFTVWGALHGLETFSQLIWKNYNHFYVNETNIMDWPRYPHRGIMIDTARHFISPDIILKILDGMSYNKLNTLHWHLTDDQSIPYVSSRFPELSDKGAYIPGVLVYDQPMVQSIIEYGKSRGIRIILEIDTPGHTLAFGLSHPELLTPCYGDGVTPGTPNYNSTDAPHAPYEILDPTKETTYTFMKELFTEVFQVSKDAYLHLGMDEVYYHCWNSSPEIKAFMDEHGYTNISQVQQHYTERHLKMIKELGANAIIWQDPLDYGVEVDKETVVVQIWKDDHWESDLQKALDKGYKVLLSSCWYLNYINYGESWKAYYECDPVYNETFVTPELQKLILGGEAAMWAEFVDNTNIIQRLFPFVSAVAERLWSAKDSSTTDDAKWRLDEHRCRMLARGLDVQPIFNGYCSESEFGVIHVDKDNAVATNAGNKGIILFCVAILHQFIFN